MNIHLKLTKKFEEISGTVSLVFTPVLLDADASIYAMSGNINLALPKENDTFVVGKTYDMNLNEIIDEITEG